LAAGARDWCSPTSRRGHAGLLQWVSDLDETLAHLGARGLGLEGRVELPLGSCATFEARRPVACLCQLTRPDVDEHFIGRADF
jgi:hypothetical protein